MITYVRNNITELKTKPPDKISSNREKESNQKEEEDGKKRTGVKGNE